MDAQNVMEGFVSERMPNAEIVVIMILSALEHLTDAIFVEVKDVSLSGPNVTISAFLTASVLEVQMIVICVTTKLASRSNQPATIIALTTVIATARLTGVIFAERINVFKIMIDAASIAGIAVFVPGQLMDVISVIAITIASRAFNNVELLADIIRTVMMLATVANIAIKPAEDALNISRTVGPIAKEIGIVKELEVAAPSAT